MRKMKFDSDILLISTDFLDTFYVKLILPADNKN